MDFDGVEPGPLDPEGSLGELPDNALQIREAPIALTGSPDERGDGPSSFGPVTARVVLVPAWLI